MKQALTLLVCLFSFYNLAQAQGSIKGNVLDAENQAALYANVVLHSAKDSSMVKGGITDENGDFQLLNVPFDQYYLQVSYVGFAPYLSPNFALNTSEKTFETITLQPLNAELGEVTVVAQRPILEMKPDKMVMNVDKTINATGENALSLLRKSPGVVIDNNENVTLLGKSGVQVYIDGKPSPLSGNDLATFLKTLQSDQIDAIEIITNPSAKYDAEGNAGIVNIRMKKDSRLGANANLNLNYSIGQNAQYNGTITGNYRNKKINTFGSYTYFDGISQNYINFHKEQAGLGFDSEMNMFNYWEGHSAKFGTDFYLNDKHTVGFLVNGFTEENSFESENNTFLSTLDIAGTDSVLVAQSNSVGTGKNLNTNLNYVFNIGEGTKLNVDLDYGIYRYTNSGMQPNAYMNSTKTIKLSEINFATETPTNIDIASVKADYETPLFNGQFGTGVKVTNIVTDNTFDFYNVVEDAQFLDEDRSNNFVYTEQVNAIYANYSGKVKKVSYQAGLRVEQTQSEGDLTAYKPVNDENVKRSYTDFFPSLSLSYALNDNHNFQASYSRRINRPNYEDLNPFEEKLDALTSEQGNAFLNPEYTNKFEIRHSFKYMLNTTLSYSKTNDVIARILAPDMNNEQATFITWLNIAEQDFYSLNISAPVPITKWWSSFQSFTAYYLHNQAMYENGNVDIEAKAINVYSQHTFRLPYDISLEVSGWYSSPSIWEGNFATEAMWAMDAGIQKKILKERGNIKLAISDIFRTQEWNGTTELGGMYMNMWGGWDSRRFKVNFSYLFGNEKVKNRNRKTGLESETQRIKSDK